MGAVGVVGVVGALCAASAVLAAGPSKMGCLSECTPRIGIVSAFGEEANILLAATEEWRDWMINGNRYSTGNLRVVVLQQQQLLV